MNLNLRYQLRIIPIAVIATCLLNCESAKQQRIDTPSENRGTDDGRRRKGKTASKDADDWRNLAELVDSKIKKDFLVPCGDSVFFYSPRLGWDAGQSLGEHQTPPSGIVQAKNVDFYSLPNDLTPADRANGKELDGWVWMYSSLFREWTEDDGWGSWKDGQQLQPYEVKGLADSAYFERGVFFLIAVGRDSGRNDLSAFYFSGKHLWTTLTKTCDDLKTQ